MTDLDDDHPVAALAELDQLRAEADALGVKVDGRWGLDRLRREIADARRRRETADTGNDAPAHLVAELGPPAPAPTPQPEPELGPPAPEPAPAPTPQPEPAPAPPPAPVGRTRTWEGPKGRRTTRVGSGLDRAWAALPDWHEVPNA